MEKHTILFNTRMRDANTIKPKSDNTMEYLIFRVKDDKKEYLTLANIANEWTGARCNATTFGDHNVLDVCDTFEGSLIEIK